MDDRDLEARLRTHLHLRFDGGSVPSGLTAAVRQGLAHAPTAKVGFSLRPRMLQLGWIATGLIAVVLGGFVLDGRVLGPANPGVTQTPSTTPVPTLHVIVERQFIVLAPNGTEPSAAERDDARQVLMDRLGMLGLTNTTVTEHTYAIAFALERDGLPDDAIRRILAATGEIEFVPLPAADYGEGKLVAEVGKPLPKDEPALFGWEGIESVGRGTDQQDRPTLNFTLTPAARQAFGDYTADHVTEYLAIVIDGRVALMPVINEPIPGGEIAISGGGLPGSPEATKFDEASAILIGGRLPDAWQGADALAILDRDKAIEAGRASGAGGDVDGASVDVLGDTRWTPVWRVSFADGAVVTVDAVTGAWVSTLIP
jgi:hypothetical protein